MDKTMVCRGVVGFLAILSLSGVAYGACSFVLEESLPDGYSVQDSISDLSGQGNISCNDIIGSDGESMREEMGVVFERNGYWNLPEEARIVDGSNFVTNTPDIVMQFPQGNGSRCSSTFYRVNALRGYADIGGNVDTRDSIACTDDLVNVEEVIREEPPAIITTTGDGCVVTVKTDGTDISGSFDVFMAGNLDGSNQALCNASGETQNQCVRACPEFVNVEELQDRGLCQSDTRGFIPLSDTDDETGESVRCTPCLTATEAEEKIPGFDAGGKKLCWEFVNSVQENSDRYRPHKKVREEAKEITYYNDCYEATTTILWYGIEIPFTYTTCI